MKVLIIFNVKFKKDISKLKKLLDYNAFRQINSTTYIGELSNNELEILRNEIKQNFNENDTIIVTPICKNCIDKVEIIGQNIEFDEEQYKIL
ncbi:MAG: CRISPR-associated endonuclease Cas2 [Methanobrevibacter sp.]|uniref:CRISPR-associated endonuclease Cas2 n=1 Tax=Methanobrevibacter sp. TaxID=66852 RepID=UPI0026DFD6C9|nr:CRISPR-associated endonuclease Cas2 [Methanobrevibacter sp.]MDO5849411.1 CRISPR-associated endonuclease Cas2 [Methanobrevibacter sp.]